MKETNTVNTDMRPLDIPDVATSLIDSGEAGRIFRDALEKPAFSIPAMPPGSLDAIPPHLRDLLSLSGRSSSAARVDHHTTPTQTHGASWSLAADCSADDVRDAIKMLADQARRMLDRLAQEAAGGDPEARVTVYQDRIPEEASDRRVTVAEVDGSRLAIGEVSDGKLDLMWLWRGVFERAETTH
jgi:hypothetical protein